MKLAPLPFDVSIELPGWCLFWALLARTDSDEPQEQLDLVRTQSAERARARLELETLAEDPAVAALRALFKAAGTSPSRYRPSSEALARRVLKGDAIPRISPLVDINNCLSLDLLAPCCVMVESALAPPFRFRRGEAGESYESLRGPFKLEGRPLLVDSSGPLDAPITGSVRVKVSADTETAWLVAYLPAGVIEPGYCAERLDQLLAAAPIAQVLRAGASSSA